MQQIGSGYTESGRREGMNCEEKAAINSIEELPKIALKIGPKLKDIRDSLSDALLMNRLANLCRLPLRKS